MLSRLLSCLPSVVSGGLVGLIVALGFQVLPDICCDDDPTVFHLHEFLATIVIIVLIVSLFGFLNSSARKSSKLRFMLRFKSVVIVGVLTMFIPVLGISIGARGSEPLWQFGLAGIIGGGAWSVPFAIADSDPKLVCSSCQRKLEPPTRFCPGCGTQVTHR